MKNYLVIHSKGTGEEFQDFFLVQGQTHEDAARAKPALFAGVTVTTVEVEGEWQRFSNDAGGAV